MALLLNRKYGSRLECLYYILKSIYNKFKTNNYFALKDLKYNEKDENNVHKYCQLLIDCVGLKCCPFLVNPLNSSKCYATQSLESDSTKSKAVSDIGGSLEALGFITRNKNKYCVSHKGEMWVKCSFSSYEWSKIALEGVLSYGVVIGFLSKIIKEPDVFSYSGIYLSYPQTTETVEYSENDNIKKIIKISTDSQRDSNTRTMSRIIGWCVAVGLLEPITDNFDNNSLPHIKYRDFLNKGELTIKKYKKTELCKTIFNTKRVIDNPLSYSRLHKNVGSLRENGGKDLRNITMKYNKNILNRRYVFVKVLNYYSKNNMKLSFTRLVDIMTQYSEFFFTSGNNPYDIMTTESEICDIVGIPFSIDGDYLVPLTTINEKILEEDADSNIIKLSDSIIKKITSKNDI